MRKNLIVRQDCLRLVPVRGPIRSEIITQIIGYPEMVFFALKKTRRSGIWGAMAGVRREDYGRVRSHQF